MTTYTLDQIESSEALITFMRKTVKETPTPGHIIDWLQGNPGQIQEIIQFIKVPFIGGDSSLYGSYKYLAAVIDGQFQQQLLELTLYDNASENEIHRRLILPLSLTINENLN